MNRFFRALIAGYGAKKLGGGCLSTIIIFFVIYYALGNCNSRSPQTRHTNIHLQTHSSTSISYLKNNGNTKTVASLYR
ncbi:MAG: hypothetical protein ABIQ56_01755 [Chitinophagaceae bacterium]